MSQKKSSADRLMVHPPIVSRHLGRYTNTTCIFLIRKKNTVLYIGKSKSAYDAILRLFQKGGLLAHLDRQLLTFEIILSTARLGPIEAMLKLKLKPKYNYIAKTSEKNYSVYQVKQAQRLWETYLELSRFDVLGEHQADEKN